MPLIDKTGFMADNWVRVGDAALPHAGSIIVPFARLEEVLSTPHPCASQTPSPLKGESVQRTDEGSKKFIGVHVSNTIRIEEIKPYLNQLALISVNFPSFSDGRGFSIAHSLRNAGFTGELRAFGPLIADQYAFTLSCGFDTIEIPETLAERQPEEQWKAAFATMSNSYQRGYKHGCNILDQRRVGAV